MPPTPLHETHQGTDHCISHWSVGAHGRDLETWQLGDALNVHLGRPGKIHPPPTPAFVVSQFDSRADQGLL